MKTITAKIKLIGGMLSFMIAVVVGITVYINHTSRQDSVVINVAGKERMLSQKITKEVFWLHSHGLRDFTLLDRSIAEFDGSLADLIDGNAERGIYAPPRPCIKERLEQVRALWSTFGGDLETYKKLLSETAAMKSELLSENETILHISDRVVKQMVAEGLGGSYIDDAGRQRMLTQRIALYTTRYLLSGEPEHFARFQEAYGLYDTTLKGFVADPRLTASGDLKALLQENDTAWQHYSRYIVTLMEQQRQLNEVVVRIKELSPVLLDTMDSAVAAYTAYSENQREFLQYFQYAASLLAVMAMLYSVLLTRRIQEHFGDFLKQSEAMASSLPVDEETVRYMPSLETAQKDELTLASMHMSQFVEKMHTILQHAQQAIHESEQAAKELATVTEAMDDELDELDLDEAAKKDIDKTIDRSEDIVIQTLEELSGTSRLLTQLQNNLNTIISKTTDKPGS